jgi:hypothetical protein
MINEAIKKLFYPGKIMCRPPASYDEAGGRLK